VGDIHHLTNQPNMVLEPILDPLGHLCHQAT